MREAFRACLPKMFLIFLLSRGRDSFFFVQPFFCCRKNGAFHGQSSIQKSALFREGVKNTIRDGGRTAL